MWSTCISSDFSFFSFSDLSPLCTLVSTRWAVDAVTVWFSVVIGFSYLSAHW
jgi:hypothetical protein